jgi:ATP-dependent DNA helicase PIF1
MLIKNYDESLVNGSMGRVVEFRLPNDLDDPSSSKPPSASASSSKSKSSSQPTQKYPVVEFLMPGGGRSKVLVTPETFKVELPSGEVQAQRLQVRSHVLFFRAKLMRGPVPLDLGLGYVDSQISRTDSREG